MVALAVRMKFSTVMPGTEIGLWKDMKIPSLARSLTAILVMSLPSNTIDPLSTLYTGFPIITFAKVDLPAPLVPITTWISPLLIVKSRPLRICLPSTDASIPVTLTNSAKIIHSFIAYYLG